MSFLVETYKVFHKKPVLLLMYEGVGYELMYAFNWKFWDTVWVLMAESFYFSAKAKTMLLFRYWPVKKWKLAG